MTAALTLSEGVRWVAPARVHDIYGEPMLAVRVIVDGGEMLFVLAVVAGLMAAAFAYGRASRR